MKQCPERVLESTSFLIPAMVLHLLSSGKKQTWWTRTTQMPDIETHKIISARKLKQHLEFCVKKKYCSLGAVQQFLIIMLPALICCRDKITFSSCDVHKLLIWKVICPMCTACILFSSLASTHPRRMPIAQSVSLLVNCFAARSITSLNSTLITLLSQMRLWLN